MSAGAALLMLAALGGSEGDHAEPETTPGHVHGQPEHPPGPHGGRLLRDGEFEVELEIFEAGTPPQLRVYAYRAGRLLDPTSLGLTVELRRLGGHTEAFRFTPQDEYLLGDRVVAEPHSFDVTVAATHAGRTSRWEYASYEGRVALTPAMVETARLQTAVTGPATLRATLRLTGQIVPNEERMALVTPRFPGIVKEVRKRLGDAVGAGEVLAVIQSNESLQTYAVQSPLAGTVIRKRVTPGEFVAEGAIIYVVADLGTVWVDLNAYPQDLARLRTGQRVVLDAGAGIAPAEGDIAYLSPFGAASTQAVLARVVLPNPTGAWRPGLFVTAEVILEAVRVPLAVRREALQTYRDWDVVFIQEGDLFEVRPVELGRRDGEWVEVLAGLVAGQRYATANSFILKADLGKVGASHAH